MMKFAMAALMALSVAGTANAQSVDQRHANQQQRIENGEATGQLTPREAARAERQQGRIDRQEARMRARHGGHLTMRERAHLQRRENHASRTIYRLKHNRRVG